MSEWTNYYIIKNNGQVKYRRLYPDDTVYEALNHPGYAVERNGETVTELPERKI